MQTTSPQDASQREQWSRVLAASERVDWKIEAGLVRTKELTFLTDDDRYHLTAPIPMEAKLVVV